VVAPFWINELQDLSALDSRNLDHRLSVGGNNHGNNRNGHAFEIALVSKTYYAQQSKILAYDKLLDIINGWIGYAMWANTYKLRKEFMNSIREMFCNKTADKGVNRWLKV